MKSVGTMSTWRDVVKRDRCRDRLAAVKSCNRPSYRVTCKRTVVNRNCLTRSEHTEMLSTPKGYLWTGARGLSYVLMRDCESTDGVRRGHVKTANDADAMWQEFVKQFLLIANDELSPTTKTILPKMLMSKKIVYDPKWSSYPNTQAKLCSFFSNLNLECNSSKWKQEFLQSLSSLIFDYIVQVLYCDRITKTNKLLTSELLQNINDITQEHGSVQPSPDSYVQGVQIFIANLLTPWLAKSTVDFCQGTNSGLLIKSNINNEYREQEPSYKRHKKYYRSSNKTPVVSTSHHGHKNKFKKTKKINRVKSKSNVNKTDVNEAINVTANVKKWFDSDIRENKHSKANNGLKGQNRNRIDKIKSVTNRVKTKQNHKDAVNNTIGIGSTEKEAKTKKIKFPKLKIPKNKNNNKIGFKSKLMSSKITNYESKERYNKKRLKAQHDRKRDIIGKNDRSINKKPLKPESKIEYDNTYALDKNKAINENRLENNGEIISIKSDLLNMLKGIIINHQKVSSTDDEKPNKKTVKRSKAKNLSRKNGDKPASKPKMRKNKTNGGKLTRIKSKSKKSKLTNGESSNIRNSDETKKRLNENESKTQHDRKNDTIRKDSGAPSNGELLERKSQIKHDDTYALDDSEETAESKGSTNEKSNATESGIGTDRGNHGETIAVGSSDNREHNPDYNDDINSINKWSINSQIKYDDAFDDNEETIKSNHSVNREPNVNENRLENDDVIDEDRENRGETIVVESDDGDSDNIDNETNKSAPSTRPEDQLSCTQSYDDIRAEKEFESCVSDEMNAFLQKLSTNCNKPVAKTTTTDKLGELNEICYQKISNNARTRFVVDETGNKTSTDNEKCSNRNPGIVYRICKRDGSNYSVCKTILPTRENDGDPTFAVHHPAVKAKLIMRMINEVDHAV